MALVHAGLVPLEAQESVKHVFESLAPTVSMSPDVLLTTVDKSVPTAAGLAGVVLCCFPLPQLLSDPQQLGCEVQWHSGLAWVALLWTTICSSLRVQCQVCMKAVMCCRPAVG